jgi:cyclic pyranopterin phosphate synthase
MKSGALSGFIDVARKSPTKKRVLCAGKTYAQIKQVSPYMGEITFTHIRDDHAAMVDISGKDVTPRHAVATGRIKLRRETIAAISAGRIEKGNVLATARIAAITAIKETSRIIPMCHQIPITGIDVDFEVVGGADCDDGADDADGSDVANTISALVTVASVGRTGVEMEALCGVSVALLTIWDMVKSAEKDESGNYPDTAISGIGVLEKVKY